MAFEDVEIIADAGGTKTEWNIISRNCEKPVRILTQGFNAVVSDSTVIRESVADFRLQAESLGFNVQRWFGRLTIFAAGCRSDAVARKLEEIFREIFYNVSLRFVCRSDLEGAAVGLFGDDSGMAAILGTGSAAGWYDGKSLVADVPSMGYVLGDEGSGAFMGRILINMYFRKELPMKIREELSHLRDMRLDEVLRNVYNLPGANRYLASFVPFIKNHEEDKEIKEIIEDSLKLFFEKIVKKYNRILGSGYNTGDSIRFVGGVACAFADQIRQISPSYGLIADRFLQNPLESIIEYYNETFSNR